MNLKKAKWKIFSENSTNITNNYECLVTW